MTVPSADEPCIREYRPTHLEEVAGVWHRSGQASYPYLPTWQTFNLEKAVRVFRVHIAAQNQIWIGLEGVTIVAFLAMSGSKIDRLYVDPPHWRKGWGTRFVDFAKERYPDGLDLMTHQANTMARALYEKKGFKAVRFGTSPAPESAPDVEYHWRP